MFGNAPPVSQGFMAQDSRFVVGRFVGMGLRLFKVYQLDLQVSGRRSGIQRCQV